MLQYLINATEYLTATGIILGLFAGYIPEKYRDTGGRCIIGGTAAGFVCAAVMAYLKNKTKLIRTDTWNLRIFRMSLVVFILFLIVDTALMHKKSKKVTGILAPVCVAILVFCQMFYSLPDVLAYPYTIVLGGEAFFSTGFLYRVIGLALGILLIILMAAAVRFVTKKAGITVSGILTKCAYLILAIQQAIKILQVLYSRRTITDRRVFPLIKFASNHASVFLYGMLGVAVVIPLLLWAKSFRHDELYSNPAELRKIKATRRSVRRWASVTMLTFLIVVLNITAIKAYANRPVELSAIEECVIEDGAVVIPFTQVEDGHLHRFAYTTSEGVVVRFIIIKKPNSSAYGVGLDSCDICGETGYYERSGQVICNRCDVIMNINTIGFKGGCNPQVVDYRIEDAKIIIPIDALDTPENNKTFR